MIFIFQIIITWRILFTHEHRSRMFKCYSGAATQFSLFACLYSRLLKCSTTFQTLHTVGYTTITTLINFAITVHAEILYSSQTTTLINYILYFLKYNLPFSLFRLISQKTQTNSQLVTSLKNCQFVQPFRPQVFPQVHEKTSNAK